MDPRFVVGSGDIIHYFTPEGKKGEIPVLNIIDQESGEIVEKSYPGKKFIWELPVELPAGTIFRIKNRVNNGCNKEKILY